MKRLAAVVALAVSLVAGQAAAQNLVQNPSFESAMTSWTSSNWGPFPPPIGAHTGAGSAGTGCVGSACLNTATGALLQQDIPTTVGASYTLTFWYVMDPGNPTELQAHVSAGAPTGGGAGTCTGTCVFGTTTSIPTWTQATRTFTATSATTRVTFLGRHDPAGVYVDDVSVVLSAPVATVPTLSEWAMILFSILLAGGAALHLQRRRLAA